MWNALCMMYDGAGVCGEIVVSSYLGLNLQKPEAHGGCVGGLRHCHATFLSPRNIGWTTIRTVCWGQLHIIRAKYHLDGPWRLLLLKRLLLDAAVKAG